MNTESDLPGVPVPPPLIFAGALVAGLALDRGARTSPIGTAFTRIGGWGGLASGIAIGAAAVRQMRTAETPVDPRQPVNALVTSGVFAFTRNPIYVAMTSVSVGVALLSRSIPALALVPVALALLDHYVVENEEAYLERRFGETYRAYRRSVPRWF